MLQNIPRHGSTVRGVHFKQRTHPWEAREYDQGSTKQTVKRTLVYRVYEVKQEGKVSLCPASGDSFFTTLRIVLD